MSKRPVVFDLDGTLVDSRRDIVVAANHVRQSAGLPALPDEVVAGFVGDGARYLIENVMGLDRGDPNVDRHLAAFLDYYEAHAVDHTVLMPHAEAAMDALADRPLALCTNKSQRTTLAVLDGLGIAQRFRVVVAGGDTAQNKPSAEPLLLVARELGVEPRDLVMVGDGPQDIESARAAGAFGVGVRGGILPIERLVASAPSALLEDLSQLSALVEELDGAR
jgi:2-phosphoglycolate phosphatase